MAAETGFLIEGTIYEVPGLESFTMDEAQILYDNSGLTLEDFSDDEADVKTRMKNPGLMRSLMEIAYRRGNPHLKPQQVKDLIGSVNQIDSFSTLAEADDVDPTQPSTLNPSPNSPSEPTGSNRSSGPDSVESSDPPGNDPASIGIGGSDTSFPQSDPLTLVS